MHGPRARAASETFFISTSGSRWSSSANKNQLFVLENERDHCLTRDGSLPMAKGSSVFWPSELPCSVAAAAPPPLPRAAPPPPVRPGVRAPSLPLGRATAGPLVCGVARSSVTHFVARFILRLLSSVCHKKSWKRFCRVTQWEIVPTGGTHTSVLTFSDTDGLCSCLSFDRCLDRDRLPRDRDLLKRRIYK